MPDITALILDEHTWFREQFAALDDLQAADPLDTDAVRAVWEPLAARLDVHAIAEEQIFYPQLLTKGEDPEAETLDAIGDHNDIRDGVHAAARHPIGTRPWWDAVGHARAANDEHMAEEEREGLADFRLHAPTGLRAALGARFAEFVAAHPSTAGLDTSDKNPAGYVHDIESARAAADVSRGDWDNEDARRDVSLGIGKPERTMTTMTASDHLLRDLAPIPGRAWKVIDDEARERLTPLLAARRLADWSGARRMAARRHATGAHHRPRPTHSGVRPRQQPRRGLGHGWGHGAGAATASAAASGSFRAFLIV